MLSLFLIPNVDNANAKSDNYFYGYDLLNDDTYHVHLTSSFKEQLCKDNGEFTGINAEGERVQWKSSDPLPNPAPNGMHNGKKVTDLSGLFENCYNINTLDVSKFDTSNVTNMKKMFYDTYGVRNIIFGKWNTANVKDMSFMFYGCSGIKKLDLNFTSTPELENMYCMFWFCTGLESLNLKCFQTDKVTEMMYLFYWCTSLKKLDISNFNFSKCNSYRWMFYSCANLSDIKMDQFSLRNKSYYDITEMFYDTARNVSSNEPSKIYVKDQQTAKLLNNYVQTKIDSEKLIVASKIYLDKDEAVLEKNNTLQLNATLDKDYTSSGFTWKSSNNKVATVDQNGLVTAISNGTATITNTSNDNSASAECDITVKTSLKTLCFEKDTYYMNLYSGLSLTPTFDPEDTSNKELSWSSSNESIVTVNESGYIFSGYTPGTSKITAVSKENGSIKAECKVIVREPVRQIQLEKNNISLTIGESLKNNLIIKPENATDKSITWLSTNDKVATVDDEGNIKAISTGTAIITAMSNSDNAVKATCNVTVNETEAANNQDSNANIQKGNINEFVNKSDNPKVNDQNSKISQCTSMTDATKSTSNDQAELKLEKQNSKHSHQYKLNSAIKSIIKKITNIKDNKDLKKSSYAKLKLKASEIKNVSQALKWNKVKGTSKYLVFGGLIGKKYKYLCMTNSTSFRNKKVKKGVYYKYIVIAMNGNGKTLATSKIVFVTTKGSKMGNPVSIKIDRIKVRLKKEKKLSIRAKTIGTKIKNFRKLSFESLNTKVVTVSNKGRIKAKGKGTTSIYIYAQNGISKTVKVIVE